VVPSSVENRSSASAPSASATGDFGFPPSARVRARAEFDSVFKDGRRAAGGLMALHFLADAAPPRLGLAVSRKVDTRAVGRNRIKRALRERFRRHRGALASGAYVVVARGPAARATNAELARAFEQLLQRLGALPAAAGTGTMPPVSAISAPAASVPDTSPSAPDRTGASSPSAS
jgi:ribonuclease P protein component